MFTGLIQALGSVKTLTKNKEDVLLEIETRLGASENKIGDSISVNGVCLTIVKLTGKGFQADVSAETLSRTNLGEFRPGDKVNLERSVRASDLLGGHIVLGHIDCLGRVAEKAPRANSIMFGIEIEKDMMRYLVEKGSVAIDGISLTINKCEAGRFFVNVIPLTAQETTLGFKKTGDKVNIETDIIGKYVENFLRPGKGINKDFLARHGYID